MAHSFYPLFEGFGPLENSSHVVLEAQRDMAGSQCDMASLLLGILTQKATSELSQRWQVQFLFGFLFA